MASVAAETMFLKNSNRWIQIDQTNSYIFNDVKVLTRFPVPVLATQPHYMMDPPPNLTEGNMFFSWNSVCFFRHAYHLCDLLL